MTCCPTCGAPYPRSNDPKVELRVDLNTNRVLCGTREVRVPPQLAELLALLLTQEGKAVAVEYLATGVWGAGRAPETYRNVLSTYAARLSKVLAPFGYDIYRAGQGEDRTLALARSYGELGFSLPADQAALTLEGHHHGESSWF